MKVLNLTGREIRVVVDGKVLLQARPSGQTAQVWRSWEKVAPFCPHYEDGDCSAVAGVVGECKDPCPYGMGVPVKCLSVRIEGLPEPCDGTVYLVSPSVLTALRQLGLRRPDVYCPDPATTVESTEGVFIVRELLSGAGLP